MIDLKLVVNPIATDDHAHELGENFVRIAKSLLDEGHPPGKQIGPGNYDYHITVYWWPDQVFDRGVKWIDEDNLHVVIKTTLPCT